MGGRGNNDQRRIALVETRTLGTDSSPAQLIRYQLSNHLQSATLELDDRGQIISYEEYYPYGSTAYQSVRNQTETPKRYRYTGKERDEETGLYYHGARYYAAWLGRWTAADPAGMVDGVNLYGYVRAMPIRLADPTGQKGKHPVEQGKSAPSKPPGIQFSSTATLPIDDPNLASSQAQGSTTQNKTATAQKGAANTSTLSPNRKVVQLDAKRAREILIRALEASNHGYLSPFIKVDNGVLRFDELPEGLPSRPNFWAYLVAISNHEEGAIIDTGRIVYAKGDSIPESMMLSGRQVVPLVPSSDIWGITFFSRKLAGNAQQYDDPGDPERNVVQRGPSLAVLNMSTSDGTKQDIRGLANTIIHELVLHIGRAILGEPSGHKGRTRELTEAFRAAGNPPPLYELKAEIDRYFKDPNTMTRTTP